MTTSLRIVRDGEARTGSARAAVTGRRSTRLRRAPFLTSDVAGRLPGQTIFPDQEYPHPSPYLDLPPLSVTTTESDPLEQGWTSTSWPAISSSRPFGWHYREMRLKDPEIAALVEGMAEEVLACDYVISPGGEGALAKEIRDFSEFTLEEADWVDCLLKPLMLAPADGFACCELVYGDAGGSRSGLWGLSRILYKEMHHFGFLKSSRGPVFGYRDETGRVIPAPPGKFIRWSHGGGSSPWGLALLDFLVPTWYDSLYTRHWENDDEENWARPAAGCGFKRMPGDGDDVRQENADRLKLALELAAGLHADGEVAFDEEVYSPKFFEVSRPGGSRYRESAEAKNRTKARLFRGEIQLTGLRPGTGTYASDEVALKRSYIKTRLRARALSRRVNLALRWIATLNWGPEAPAAVMHVVGVDDEHETLLKGLEVAEKYGRPVPQSHLERVSKVPAPSFGEASFSPRTQS